jgi:hypothetical protein
MKILNINENILYFIMKICKKNYFVNLLMTKFLLNTTYSLLIKLGFNNHIFYMVGNQIGLIIRNFHNIKHYKNILDVINSRIEDLIARYKIDDLPLTINLMYKIIVPLPDLVLKNISNINININKNIFSIKELKQIFNSKYLPLTNNMVYFGNSLEGSKKKIFN